MTSDDQDRQPDQPDERHRDEVVDELAHGHSGTEIAMDLIADRDDDPTVGDGLRPRGPFMKVLHGYRVGANAFAGVLGVLSAALIFPTVGISVVNVVLRRLGASQGRNLTSNWLIEAQWYMYTLMFVLGLAYILREGINVRVDFWFANRSSKTQSWIDLVGHCIALLPFAYIGIKYSWPSVKLSWEAREGSPDAGGLPRYPIKTALMFGFVFLMIQGIAEVIKNIEFLRGHEYRHESDDPTLAGGQSYSVEDFALGDVAASSGLAAGVTDDRRGT